MSTTPGTPKVSWHSTVDVTGDAISHYLYLPHTVTPFVQACVGGDLQVSMMYLTEREAQAAIEGLRMAAMQIEHAERRRKRLAAILREGLTPCDARDNGHE